MTSSPGPSGRRFHVGLNLLYLVPGETGGTETYARELIPELQSLAPDVHLTAFINREAAAAGDAPWTDLIPSVTVPIRARSRLEWVRGEQLLLPGLARRAGVDLLHSLANTAPARGAFRRVVTIHDLINHVVPESRMRLRALGMRALVPLAARRAHRIIVDAAATRADLERHLRISPERVDVVPLGFGRPSGTPPTPEATLRASLDAGDRPIVLTASAKLPHKNLTRLIEALALIPAPSRPLLVLTGYPTPHEATLAGRAADLGLGDDVRILGWVSDEDLEGLYAACAAFVFPSLYEGFGLPVLEAMARGAPVACSDRGALAEVAGDAALHFDPESVASIASAVQALLSDRALTERLRERGRERAARFSWRATAEGTLLSYERTLRSAP